MRIFLYHFFYCTIILSCSKALAQKVPAGGGRSSLGDKDFSFMPIPYINYNNTIGFALGAIPMAMYRVNPKDTISPASMTGIMGMYTTNETWFGLFFQKLYLKEDTWRLTLAGGLGSVNNQFYLDAPISGFIGYNTMADFLIIDAQRKILPKLYGGVHYILTVFDTTFETEDVESPGERTQQGFGIKLSFDLRDDVYYPRIGSLSEIDWTTYPEAMDNEFVTNKIEVYHNRYISTRRDIDVIAARVYGGFGIGDVPFEQQFVVGNSDIRGYSEGKYRGNYLFAIQGEYRWNFYKKMSAVGFIGLATIFEGINKDDDGKILPGVGTGFRYNVFPKNHLNVGFDVAVGADDWGFYFRIGESF